MLTVSTLAVPEAPRSIVVSAEEIGQDIRFAYLNGSLSTDLATVVSSFATRMLLLVTGTRKDQIGRIDILPGGDLRIRQGEPVNFSAVPYSVEGTPIGGMKFDWSVRDVGRDQPERPMPNGVFHAGQAGIFVVTARSQGYQAQGNVTVEENKPLMAMRGIQTAIARGKTEYVDRLKREGRFTSNTISSKANYGEPLETVPDNVQEDSTSDPPSDRPSGPNAASGEAVYPAGSAAMMRPADEDGWGNGNWWLADDPGNPDGDPAGHVP